MWLTVTKITSSYQLNKPLIPFSFLFFVFVFDPLKPLIPEARRFHQETFRGCLVKVLREFIFFWVISGKRSRKMRVISERENLLKTVFRERVGVLGTQVGE